MIVIVFILNSVNFLHTTLIRCIEKGALKKAPLNYPSSKETIRINVNVQCRLFVYGIPSFWNVVTALSALTARGRVINTTSVDKGYNPLKTNNRDNT